MQVLVDADGCPVRTETVEVARRHGASVVMVAGPSQVLPVMEGVENVRVDSAPQAADLAVANRARPGDVVVTSDYGLAAMALARGARVLCFRGRLLHAGNIDAVLATRHMAFRARRGGGRVRGPKGLSDDDRARFRETLEGLLGSPSADPG